MTPRRRAVRILTISSAMILLIATVIVASKLVSLSTIAGVSISRYESGAFERSVKSSDLLLDNNFFEPWIAHFDRGTAIAAQGDYNAAITDLERAFRTAPADRRCDVALNLSLSWESLGDRYTQQSQFAGAARLYALAKAALDAAGSGCGGSDAASGQAAPSPGEGSPRERLEAKSRQAARLDVGATAQQVPGAPNPLGQLKEQGDVAQQEKSDRSRERDFGQFGSLPGDKPW